jgi:WD40 repeat protein/serine/threonine protein kinase
VSPCPARERLEELLSEQLDGEMRATIEAHIEGCAACQTILTELAGNSLPDRGQPISWYTPTPDFLNRLKRELPELWEGQLGPVATFNDMITEGPGTVIGPYKLLEQIGEGGFGVVFRAEQTQPLRRKVALKILKPGMDTRQVVARFEAERQALALMDHPNIARVIDGGMTGEPGCVSAGRPYFVMELVRGTPITDFCDQNHLSVRDRLELFVDVCQAVQHAHQKGIIHRDLKPTNVMVAMHDDKPVVKVIDFGIAKAAGQQLTDKTLFTNFAQLIGTPLYMSPEQAGQSSLHADTRSDIYSLGVLMYELLTGTTPFDKERLRTAAYDEMRRIILEEEPPRPSTRMTTHGQAASTAAVNRKSDPKRLSQLFRGELDWIVMKCLEKDRNRRYETASTLAADVRRYLSDEPVQACPPSATYRIRKFARRNRAAFITTGVVALALVVGTVVSVWQAVRATRALEAESLARQDADTNLQTARLRFYAAQMNLAHQAWEAGQPARVVALLEGQRPKFGQEDLRCFEWYYLWRLCHPGYRLTLHGHTGEVWSVAFSPDGKTLASASNDCTVRLWDVTTGQDRATLRHADGFMWVAFSPDGNTLASVNREKVVHLWEVGTGKKLAALKGHQTFLRSVAFSPDGKILATGSEDGDVRLWSVARRQQQALLRGHTGAVVSMAFSSDSRTLATASGWGADGGKDGVVRLWDVTTEPARSRLQLPPATSVAFSPDGQTLAVGEWSRVTLYDLATARERASFPGHVGRVYSVAFSPDGKTLASAARDRTVRLWDVSTGRDRRHLTHLAPVQSVAFSPDGRTLASGGEDNVVRLWDLENHTDDTTLQRHPGVFPLAFSPDGKLLIAGGDQIEFWDVATWQVRDALPNQGDRLAVSPDGKTLASRDVASAKLWDLATGQMRATIPGKRQTENTGALAFSPDGNTLAVDSYDGSVKLWDVATQGVRATLVPPQYTVVRCAAFSPDGKLVAAVGMFGWVQLWDAATGQPRATLLVGEGPWTHANAVAFSPDGNTLASSNTLGTIRLWAVDSGQLRASLKGHTDSVHSLIFFPDGKTLATSSIDGTIKLWDLVTGQERVTLKAHKGDDNSLAVAPDGNLLATGSADGTVKLWRAATDAEATAHKTDLGPDDSDSPVSHNNLGDRLRAAGRLQEATAAYCQALSRLEDLAAAFPKLPQYRQELARSRLNLDKKSGR